MRPNRSLIVLLALMFAACGGAQTPAPEAPPPVPVTGPEGEQALVPSGQQLAAPVADISGDVLATLVLASADSILDQGATYVRPHLPPAFGQLIRPETLKQQLYKTLDAPGLEAAIDTTRPMALVVVDPKRYESRALLGSMALALPVKDVDALLREVARLAGDHTTAPWGDHLFTRQDQTLRIRISNSYALIASHEQVLAGAATVLMPLVQSPPATSARLHVAVDKVTSRFGAQMDAFIGMLRSRASRGNVQASGRKTIADVFEYLKSTRAVELSLELQPGKIGIYASATAGPQGKLATYIAGMSPGRPWGGEYLPPDSALAILTRSSPAQQVEQIQSSIASLKETTAGFVEPATLDRFQLLALQATRSFSGEMALGLRIDGNGGLIMGGASKVADPAQAQGNMRQLAQLIARELDTIMRDKIPPEARQKLQGASVRLRVRPGALRTAGVRGDLLEVIPTWPRIKDKQQRAELNKIRRGVTALFGPRITLAYATRGDVMLLALGKGYRQEMTRLAQVAGGKQLPSLQEVVALQVGQRPIVGFVYLPVATALEQGMRAMDSVTQVPAALKDAFQKIVPPARPGQDIPVIGRLVAQGPRLAWEVEVSPELVGLVVKGALVTLQSQQRAP